MSQTSAVEAFRYAHRHRAPLVVYVWDLPPWRVGNGRPDHVFALGGRLLRVPRLRGRFPTGRGQQSRLFWVARHAKSIWAPSRQSKQDIERHIGVEVTQVEYCYDSDCFLRGPAAPAAAHPVLLSVSRLVAYKNQAAVIRVAARFTPPLHVRLVGGGPEHDPLAELARELGVSCSIESNLSAEALGSAYRSAAVVVCPSRFEGFGLSPIEGIACGAQVAASDIPPHREFLGTAAEYFPLDDDPSLEAAVRRALMRGAPDPAGIARLTLDAAAARFDAALRALRALPGQPVR
jgi:glycosyltransferase involved in cell wall biosynthesis